MESIKEKIKIVQSKIDASKTDKNIKLVAVSKKKVMARNFRGL